MDFSSKLRFERPVGYPYHNFGYAWIRQDAIDAKWDRLWLAHGFPAAIPFGFAQDSVLIRE